MTHSQQRTHRKWIQARKAYFDAYYVLRTATRRRETAETLASLKSRIKEARQEGIDIEKLMEEERSRESE